MVDEAALAQLTNDNSFLFVNGQRIPFLLNVFLCKKGHRDRQQIRHKVVFSAKRLADMPDCAGQCSRYDLLCKCGWDENFDVTGPWGGTLGDLLTDVIGRINRIGRCSVCQALTPWTSSQRCPSCTVCDLAPTSGTSQCPICLEDMHDPHNVPLRCGHALCRLCASRLVYSSGEDADEVRCPCCRREQSKSSVATFLPPMLDL